MNGGVKCWKVNSGELGAGAAGTDNAPVTPVDVAGVSGATAIVGSERHTCVLVSGGVKCWGSNDFGQLGNGAAGMDNDPLMPVDVVGVSGATAITAGARHTCALVGGGVKCWGDLDPVNWAMARPIRTQAPSRWSLLRESMTPLAIAAGSTHTCALVNGGVKCWGGNQSGQLGDGSDVAALTPTEVVGVSDVTAIAAGGDNTCALVHGGVKCWGALTGGMFEIGGTTDRVTAVTVAGVHGATAITAGDWHTCALVNGDVFCWGANNGRQLGDGGTVNRHTPAAVMGISHATAIAAGALHTCAVVNGGVKCWGSNQFGQLGDGTQLERSTVVDVMGVSGATAIAAGAVHTCALVAGGVKCWGPSGSAELGTLHFAPEAVTGISGAPRSPQVRTWYVLSSTAASSAGESPVATSSAATSSTPTKFRRCPSSHRWMWWT